MKFIRNININKYKLYIDIKSKYIINKNGLVFFGNPIFNNLDDINSSNIKSKIHYISGYFLCLSIKNKKFFIYNDISGNFRLYYRSIKNKIFISDNFKKLFFGKKLKLDDEQFQFWMKKNYTIGSKSLFDEIKKIPPATKTEILNDKISHSIYFNSQNSKKNSSLNNDLKENIKKNLKFINSNNKKNILLFSGGIDSSLLAQSLIKNKINFIPIFINSIHKINEIEKNKNIADKIAHRNNFKLVEIKVDFKKYNKSKIIKNMLFDFHFSIMHFEGIKIIKKKYGKNINIICGQSADSIFSYGATANTLSHFISRLSFFYNNSLIAYVVKKNLEKKYKTSLIYLNIKKEILFYFSFYYYLYIEKSLFTKSKNTVKEINSIIKKINNKKDTFMYLKIFGFLQGSDNQVIINSCKENKINCFLPYLDPQIIYSTIQKKNSFRDIFFPKYAINNLLNNKFRIKKFRYQKFIKNKFLIKDIEKNLKKDFMNTINKLKL